MSLPFTPLMNIPFGIEFGFFPYFSFISLKIFFRFSKIAYCLGSSYAGLSLAFGFPLGPNRFIVGLNGASGFLISSALILSTALLRLDYRGTAMDRLCYYSLGFMATTSISNLSEEFGGIRPLPISRFP